MIALTKLRTLDLDAPSNDHRLAYISAASGLVRLGDFVYVIADDEQHLAVFRADTAAPGALVELVEGELPTEHRARKKQKPDFETLTLLPAFGPYAHGALLAGGSGSKPNRRRGALIGVGADGALRGEPRIVDLSFLMTPLESEFGKVNLEGMVAAGGELRVFQRGNKGSRRNGVIRLPLGEFLEGLIASGEALVPLGHRDFDLGDIGGVPLTFTDAAALASGEIAFSAVAEDTSDSYDDGRCTGAAIGLIDANGELRWVERIAEPHKIEGIDARMDSGRLSLLLVTDADNIEVPAGLFAAEIGMDR